MPKQRELFAQITALLVAQDAFEDNRGRTHIIGVIVLAPLNFQSTLALWSTALLRGQGSTLLLSK